MTLTATAVDPIIITHSDLKTYIACKRAFDLGYVQDFKLPEKPTGALALGSRVHQAIDHFHKTGDDPVKEHQRLFELDEQELKDLGAPDFVFPNLYEDAVLGRNCVVSYMEWMAREAPYAGYDIVTEVLLKAPILDGRVILMGKADLLLTRKSDGWVYIDDLKTSNRYRAGLREELERSYQHWTYMSLCALVEPDVVVGGSWYTVLFKAKNMSRMKGPPIERWPTPGKFSQAKMKLRQIEEICSEMIRMMERRETEGAHVAFPTPADHCRWCDFKHPCEMMEGNPLGARGMLDAEFVRGGRHRRYELFD